MNNPILPMEAKVIDLSYCDLDPSNNLIELPVAEEVGNVLIESVIAEQILTSTIDSKYIIIYRTGKQVKILVTIQIFINLLFSFMYFIYYVFPVLLSYVGYRGVKLFSFSCFLTSLRHSSRRSSFAVASANASACLA